MYSQASYLRLIKSVIDCILQSSHSFTTHIRRIRTRYCLKDIPNYIISEKFALVHESQNLPVQLICDEESDKLYSTPSGRDYSPEYAQEPISGSTTEDR